MPLKNVRIADEELTALSELVEKTPPGTRAGLLMRNFFARLRGDLGKKEKLWNVPEINLVAYQGDEVTVINYRLRRGDKNCRGTVRKIGVSFCGSPETGLRLYTSYEIYLPGRGYSVQVGAKSIVFNHSR